MKQLTILIACMAMGLWLTGQDIKIGKVKFPKDFIHAGKEFKAGAYHVVLTQKENVPYFVVSTVKNEQLFDEMAIVKTAKIHKKKAGKSFRIKKDFSKGDEYFRIEVFKPDMTAMAYFLVKK